MIRVESYYDRDKIVKMSKKMRNKAIVTSLLLTLILLAMGIINIISAFSEEKINIFFNI